MNKQKQRENRRKCEGKELKEISRRKERKHEKKEDEIKCNLLALTMHFPHNNVCPLSRIFNLVYYGTVLGLISVYLSLHAAWL
jgi:hypothetical protein